jgi:phenylalanyl-tRNA synthetase beta chain
MLILYSWLKDYIDFDLPPQELAEQLTLTGTRVERVESLDLGLDKIIVGKINTILPHPNADNLVVCQVDVRTEVLQIVCGARNMKVGDKVSVALVGARLPNNMEIKAAKIRGTVSNGMLCSEAELGLGEDASGLMILEPEASVGEKLQIALNLSDAILELEITPNRPDCLSIIGIAREVGAIVDRKITRPGVTVSESQPSISQATSVEIRDGELCPRYVARLIRGIKVGASPVWMQHRLKAVGFRPINNIVDVTNYVTVETGQPLHAFDFERLHEKRIVVRRAEAGEEIVTLDGVERQLGPEMLVIADGANPVALAGVMGGSDSEVSGNTTSVLLESANFNPVSISRTSRQLGLSSEASIRFERGVDPNGVLFAAHRAMELMQRLAGGEVLKGAIDVYPKTIEPRKIWFRPARANTVLGTGLSVEEMIEIAKRLELSCDLRPGTGDFDVSVPTFRPDLEREADLIEEVARIYGFYRIPSTLPSSRARIGGLSREQRIARAIRDILAHAGLWEAITYSFVSPAHFARMRLSEDDEISRAMLIKNPLSPEQSIMRTTLIPGLLTALAYNISHDIYDVQLYEVGRVFHRSEGQTLPDEEVMISAALTGAWRSRLWHEKAPTIDFYDVKGIIEALLTHLGIDDWKTLSTEVPLLHPHRGANLLISGEAAGFFGELHPDVQQAYELPKKTYVIELAQEALVRSAELERHYREIPKFPGIPVDLAVIVNENIPAERAGQVISKEGGALLKRVDIFDVYRGEQIPPGKKSLAYSLLYQAEDRTLTDAEVREIQERIVSRLGEELGAEIRS